MTQVDSDIAICYTWKVWLVSCKKEDEVPTAFDWISAIVRETFGGGFDGPPFVYNVRTGV
jgi:hypothetical protein